jgi:hypothetical protein
MCLDIKVWKSGWAADILKRAGTMEEDEDENREGWFRFIEMRLEVREG